MGLLDLLLGGDDSSSNGGRDWDRSVFDSDRFRTMAVATGWIGKMSAQEATMVTDLSIRTMMKMENGNLHTTIPYVWNHNLSSALHQRPGQNDWRQ